MAQTFSVTAFHPNWYGQTNVTETTVVNSYRNLQNYIAAIQHRGWTVIEIKGA
jgi:hypothetical protein